MAFRLFLWQRSDLIEDQSIPPNRHPDLVIIVISTSFINSVENPVYEYPFRCLIRSCLIWSGAGAGPHMELFLLLRVVIIDFMFIVGVWSRPVLLVCFHISSFSYPQYSLSVRSRSEFGTFLCCFIESIKWRLLRDQPLHWRDYFYCKTTNEWTWLILYWKDRFD